MAAKPKLRRVKFPTGVLAWFDEADRLQTTPPELAARLGKREKPEELNSFEVFLKGYLAEVALTASGKGK